MDGNRFPYQQFRIIMIISSGCRILISKEFMNSFQLPFDEIEKWVPSQGAEVVGDAGVAGRKWVCSVFLVWL